MIVLSAWGIMSTVSDAHWSPGDMSRCQWNIFGETLKYFPWQMSLFVSAMILHRVTRSPGTRLLIGQLMITKASDWLIGDHLCDFEIQIFSENLWKRQTSSMITLMRYREALFSYHHFRERAKNLHLYSLARSARWQDQSNLSDLAPRADWAVSFNPRTYFLSTRL